MGNVCQCIWYFLLRNHLDLVKDGWQHWSIRLSFQFIIAHFFNSTAIRCTWSFEQLRLDIGIVWFSFAILVRISWSPYFSLFVEIEYEFGVPVTSLCLPHSVEECIGLIKLKSASGFVNYAVNFRLVIEIGENQYIMEIFVVSLMNTRWGHRKCINKMYL